jgi:hypothetical protein
VDSGGSSSTPLSDDRSITSGRETSHPQVAAGGTSIHPHHPETAFPCNVARATYAILNGEPRRTRRLRQGAATAITPDGVLETVMAKG